MPKLKKYDEHQEEILPTPKDPVGSGVGCSDPRCEGEMMILQPDEHHPELRQLRRALCSKCKWRGWV